MVQRRRARGCGTRGRTRRCAARRPPGASCRQTPARCAGKAARARRPASPGRWRRRADGSRCRARPAAPPVSTSTKSRAAKNCRKRRRDPRAPQQKRPPVGMRGPERRGADHAALTSGSRAKSLRKSLANGRRISMVRPETRGRHRAADSRLRPPARQSRITAVKVIASSLRKGNIVELDEQALRRPQRRKLPSRQGHADHPGRHAPDQRRRKDRAALQDHRAGRARPRRGSGLQFLYQDGDGFHFMNTENYDQVTLPADMVGDQARLPGSRR